MPLTKTGKKGTARDNEQKKSKIMVAERSEPRQRSLEGCDCIVRTVMFPEPTDATNAMLDAIRPEVPALFLPGTRYRKTGVVFFGLEKVGTARQMDLFAPPKVSEASPLYKAIDAINARYGKGKVFSASEGIGDKSWKMKRSKLSKRASTRWDELMTVH